MQSHCCVTIKAMNSALMAQSFYMLSVAPLFGQSIPNAWWLFFIGRLFGHKKKKDTHFSAYTETIRRQETWGLALTKVQTRAEV